MWSLPLDVPLLASQKQLSSWDFFFFVQTQGLKLIEKECSNTQNTYSQLQKIKEKLHVQLLHFHNSVVFTLPQPASVIPQVIISYISFISIQKSESCAQGGFIEDVAPRAQNTKYLAAAFLYWLLRLYGEIDLSSSLSISAGAICWVYKTILRARK